MAKLVHVVMGNDFPAAVLDTLAAAEAYCEKMRAADKLQPKGMHRYIHCWTYDFFLNDERPAIDVGRI